MATTTAFGSSLAPPPQNEDSMEMSSPTHRGLDDDDIDIDFEDYSAAPQQSVTATAPAAGVADDEHMFEDEERPGTAHDEMMDDGVQPQVPEQVMHDDLQSTSQQQQQQQEPQEQEQDEDLLDYSEEEEQEQDQIAQQSTISLEPAMPVEQLNGVAQAGNEPDTSQLEQPTVDAGSVADVTQEQVHDGDGQLPLESSNTDQLPPPSQEAPAQVIDPAKPSLIEGEQAVFEAKDNDANPAPAEPSASAEENVIADEHDGQTSFRTDTTATTAQEDAPETPTDTGLHPMILRYGDTFMPLFKSRNQPDGLLKDDNLASLSLAELIKSCRSRLALKTDEEISEDQELVLGFDVLGLHLVEDSRPAFESSLNEVIDVYLLLHYNEQYNEVPPLALTITLQLKFTSMFTTLKRAAENGQGISSFAFLDSQEVAEEEGWQVDSYEDTGAPDAEQYGHDEEYVENTFADNAGNLTGEGHQHFEEVEHGHDGAEHNQEEYYYQEHDDTAYEGEFQDGEDHQPQGEDQEEGLQNGFQGEYHNPAATVSRTEEASANVADDALDGSTLLAGQEEAVHNVQAVLPTTDAEAAALSSSTTLEAGVTKRQAESTVVGDNPEHGHIPNPTADSGKDFSTSVQHHDGEKAGHDTAALSVGAAAANNQHEGNVSQPNESGEQPPLDHHLTTDEFEDLEDPSAYVEYRDDDEEHPQGAGNEEYPDDGQYDHTDEFDGQQLGQDAEHQPGEGEDQFHTDLDFLNDEHDENGEANLRDEQGQDDGAAVTAAQAEADDYVDFGDDVGFDEGTVDQTTSTNEQLAQTDTSATKTGSSPNGKRSYDEHADADGDFLEADAPESKKARPS